MSSELHSRQNMKPDAQRPQYQDTPMSQNCQSTEETRTATRTATSNSQKKRFQPPLEDAHCVVNKSTQTATK
eukprot:2121632-Pyramimonas_sp.AAC.1